MKNKVLLALLITLMGLALVLAANESRGRQITAFDDGGVVLPKNAEKTPEIKNQTYGQCVSEAAKIRSNCTSYEHTKYLGCLDAAKVIEKSNDKREGARQCQASYRNEKIECKTTFKTTKAECKKIKHGFFEGMRYAFA